jgi:hypothetical protein
MPWHNIRIELIPTEEMAVFQLRAIFTDHAMNILAEMTNEQTWHVFSGHPMGLFPSKKMRHSCSN